MKTEKQPAEVEGVPAFDVEAPEALISRELSWLGFARRVLALAENPDLPLFERIKFASIMGMLHDEFFMKRISGMKRRIAKGSTKRTQDGHLASEEYEASRAEVWAQIQALTRLIRDEIRPGLNAAGVPILDHDDLSNAQRATLREYFQRAVQPILTPLAVDAEHPFPFISNLGLNLAALLPPSPTGRRRFLRIKVPDNRPRWVPVPDGAGNVPLEQVIAANIDLMFPAIPPKGIYVFRVTRGAEGHPQRSAELSVEDSLAEPGMIVRVVSSELKARRFAGSVRVEVDPRMPESLRDWLAQQLELEEEDVYPVEGFLGISDLNRIDAPADDSLRLPKHRPVTHPRLKHLEIGNTRAVFDEIRRGDILLHHPYHSFDTSVLRFLESAARDPDVLAIKLTIYRTSSDSPIVKALVDAARRGKQVAVLVEITARFDEAPNIAWGKLLEEEGVHVAYGVERLKTHVKLALVVREEAGEIRRYAHVGTGNYHTGTARIYEDLGLLTTDAAICSDAASVFNALTGATPQGRYGKMLVAPTYMRSSFLALIEREVEHAKQGRPAGIRAKMNQLQDAEMIRALYRASQAGVPIQLVVRGLCCLRAGVPGLSETIRLCSIVGRYLEHSRIYRFENGGTPEYFIGSADWMKRNLDRRVETISPVDDPAVQAELAELFSVYESDNTSAWDAKPDGSYVRRAPAEGEPRREAQEVFMRMAEAQAADAADLA